VSLNVRDVLETVCDPAAGMTHAAYPSADKTLCGVPSASMTPLPGFGAPVCAPCMQTARVCRRVDRSAPAGWFLPIADSFNPHLYERS
jgi:hypothetical protein